MELALWFELEVSPWGEFIFGIPGSPDAPDSSYRAVYIYESMGNTKFSGYMLA
ncbi:hypothetical protein SAMN05216387_103122 [Nitrosovibrio tenuis]|uniref:Uncharacterized protein n=1 Tax=Nitrosovibrio tenuis TaxID=1233 RepID=A0A1H7K8P6_9PROT|nr:hypothetical protein SAMN05216387_103122 [Nitrosovibrio tenuis]